MTDLFTGLNEAQKKAVENTEGPALVIAGAGSGKTRVLTYRIAHLLKKGVYTSNILALTFTNKAAREMTNRISQLLGSDLAQYIWMGTFHSIFARILRKESDKLGYPSSFSIYDTTDSKSLIKSICADLKLDDKAYKPGDILGRISNAKNNLITPQAYYSNDKIKERDRVTNRPMLAEIYKTYAIHCKKAGAMDFDDLLLNTNILFRDFPEVLHKYQEKFKYILVDEYQDTNYSQYLIVKKLAEKHKNVCVVGDDAQSIYSFRGAQIENILNFRNDYPDYNLFKLEQNYRSTQLIVDAANSIINKNKGQIKKKVWSDKEGGKKIKIVKAMTDAEEGFIISNSILDTMLSEQLRYEDFAILYRTNAQSRIFEESLRKRNIPYKVYGGISFYERKEIKDMLAYLRLVVNPKDDEALKRIINYPARGIGKTTMGKIEEIATHNNVSIWEVLLKIDKIQTSINKGTITKLQSFVGFIHEFIKKSVETDAYQLALNMASETGIMKELYNGTSPEERSKYENLEELLNGIRDFLDNLPSHEEKTIHRYLESVALLTNADNETEEDRDKVSIMTMHSAKGLEFKHVYIAGVEDELFPSRMSIDSPKDLEEERRLLYVAVTRAMEQVTLTYALSRYKWGVPTDCEPSRFLNDIDKTFIDWPDDPSNLLTDSSEFFEINKSFNLKRKPANSFKKKEFTRAENFRTPFSAKTIKSDPNFKHDDPAKIQTGMKVEHQRFGQGVVIHMEGDLPNRKATVFFQQIKQEKQLLLKFAKLRIIT